MPNLTPDRLPIPAVRPVCGSNACIDVKDTDGRMVLTSTIPGNETFLTATYAEMNAFLDRVKDGSWDHLYRR